MIVPVIITANPSLGSDTKCQYPQTPAVDGLLLEVEPSDAPSGDGKGSFVSQMPPEEKLTQIRGACGNGLRVWVETKCCLSVQEAELERCRQLQVLIKLVSGAQ